MAATAPRFRYSNGEMTEEAAKELSWEIPVPVNKFWDSFRYPVAASFLTVYSRDEAEKLPIDPNSTANPETKLDTLRKLLQSKLAEEEAAALPKILHETEYQRWYRIWQGIYATEDELNLPQAEQTVRMLVEKRPDENNVVPPHMLAEYLLKIGKYEESEQVGRSVCEWMDQRPHLGPCSPQALSARRVIAKSLWFQGAARRAEAEVMVADIDRFTKRLVGGKYEIYLEEERKLNQEMLDEIKAKDH